ncbi:putative small lipoprotein YifL [Neisseria sp. HSC-16F19]|nr:lipoprotein [Neisseria sp. HSC-16F19]MCP2040960.1 putative small lipoprotein YifL [Neisseria sp. HSC-16F19]
MPMRLFLIWGTAALLAACGYKGDLYLPQKDDKAQFGPVQTGLGMQPLPPVQSPTTYD